ncbi:MAG: hypothetical protein ABI910_13005 [Gemmatimonadota bacterium]
MSVALARVRTPLDSNAPHAPRSLRVAVVVNVLCVRRSAALRLAMGIAGATLLALLVAPDALAQTAALISLAPSGAQVEVRVDVIGARTTALQAGFALNVPAGRYVRLGGTLAAGTAWHDTRQRASARADGIARFLLDPFRESSLGLYGIGGLSVLYDRFEQTRPRLLVGVGVEGKPRSGHVVAAELALGGGVRASVVLRRARRSGR